MAEDNHLLAQALGPGGSNVVLVDHLEHARSSQARDPCREGEPEGDRGQDEGLPVGPAVVARRRKPLEVEPEDQGQHRADDEHWE